MKATFPTSLYAIKELRSATTISKNFGAAIEDLRLEKCEKIGVLRNNHLEAVLLPADEYEQMALIFELLEEEELTDLLKVRLKTPRSEYVSFEEVCKKAA